MYLNVSWISDRYKKKITTKTCDRCIVLVVGVQKVGKTHLELTYKFLNIKFHIFKSVGFSTRLLH